MPINWKYVIEEAKKVAYDFYREHGIALTLRGIFYTLVEKKVIPNTPSVYRTLSSKLSDARLLGTFPWFLIRDETRAFTWGERG